MVVDNSSSFYIPTVTNIPEPSIFPSITPAGITGPYLKTFYSDIDNFEITYFSTRQLYEDKDGTSNRYVFAKTGGTNFVVHVGESWSWIHPDRQFTNDLKIAGFDTFRYDTTSQTIFDLQKDDTKYTLQCIHNGIESLKSECLDFVQSFKLTN